MNPNTYTPSQMDHLADALTSLRQALYTDSPESERTLRQEVDSDQQLYHLAEAIRHTKAAGNLHFPGIF